MLCKRIESLSSFGGENCFEKKYLIPTITLFELIFWQNEIRYLKLIRRKASFILIIFATALQFRTVQI